MQLEIEIEAVKREAEAREMEQETRARDGQEGGSAERESAEGREYVAF